MRQWVRLWCQQYKSSITLSGRQTISQILRRLQHTHNSQEYTFTTNLTRACVHFELVDMCVQFNIEVLYYITYVHIHAHACSYICTYILYVHACTMVSPFQPSALALYTTYIHTCIHTCCTCMHAYIHAAYIHTYVCTYVHTCIHAYIHTHKCMHNWYHDSSIIVSNNYPQQYVRT